MNLTCMYDQTPFTLGMDEKIAALRKMHAENLTHYDAHCPRCGRANPVSRERLEMATPGWEEAIKAPVAPPMAPAASSMPAAPMPMAAPAPKKAAPARRRHKPAAKKAARKAKPAAKKTAKKAVKKVAKKKPARKSARKASKKKR